MESVTIEQPTIKLAGVPPSRRRSSRPGPRFLGSGVRKNSTGSCSTSSGGGETINLRMGRMAAILGSSPDVSPTTAAPPLPSLRDGISLTISTGSSNGVGSNGLNSNGMNSSSMHSRGGGGPGSDHGSSVTGGNNRDRAPSQSSDRDVPMSGVSQSGTMINNGSNLNRKRQSVDGVEYPRRRATIAVGTICVCFYCDMSLARLLLSNFFSSFVQFTDVLPAI